MVGFRLVGRLREGTTATDLVLTVVQMLRKKGVVEKFVEYFGPGLAEMSLADRATIANMAPEYGATCGFFPVDDATLAYLRRTGRTAEEVDLVERYCKEQGLFRTAETPGPGVHRHPGAGPRHRRAEPRRTQASPRPGGPVADERVVPPEPRRPGPGAGLRARPETRPGRSRARGDAGAEGRAEARLGGDRRHHELHQHLQPLGDAGRGAPGPQGAGARACAVPPYVKTSLAPGSKVVTEYLRKSGPSARSRDPGLRRRGLRLHDLHRQLRPAPARGGEGDRRRAAAWPRPSSPGNRNFEGRVSPHVKANYLASPPLVVAYALAGTTDIDLATEPLGTAADGTPVTLADIWPSQEEIAELEASIDAEMFASSYANVFDGNPTWNAIPVAGGDLFEFREESTYIQEPPFFQGLTLEPPAAARHPRAPGSWRSSATPSPPTTSPPPATSPSTAPPAATWPRGGSRRRTSTPTARAGATTG